MFVLNVVEFSCRNDGETFFLKGFWKLPQVGGVDPHIVIVRGTVLRWCFSGKVLVPQGLIGGLVSLLPSSIVCLGDYIALGLTL